LEETIVLAALHVLMCSLQVSVKALPSTRAGALVSTSSHQKAVSVPQIIFLYQLVEGVADKSFGKQAPTPHALEDTQLCKVLCSLSARVYATAEATLLAQDSIGKWLRTGK